MEIDIMNRNTITGLAMIYALWQTSHHDLLDLIKPFVLFSVGKTTSIGSAIDIDAVCRNLEQEFGYKSFQPVVVKKVLNRESASGNTSDRRIIQKDKSFVLKKSYADLIDSFSEKRTNCKAHSDAVTVALAEYFNNQSVYGRNNYTQQEAEESLLSFFARRGSSVLLSVNDLYQQVAKNNEHDYFVGKFILEQNEKKSVLMDYIEELVKGYFVTTAIYLQAENADVTHASFSNVTFFFDTRILLGYLGYKTQQENGSVQEMVRSLKKNGAKLACFSYNEDEVESILEAYRHATIDNSFYSTYTLEHFDANGRAISQVEVAKKHFRNKLKFDGIVSSSPDQVLEQRGLFDSTEGILNDQCVHDIVSNLKPSYRFEGFSDDMAAINTVSRIREGKKLPYIEKCRAVFVTANVVLITAVKKYLKENHIDYGFPLVISGDDLCVLAWLKDFECDNKLPRMRLLENVMAAITPSHELIEAYSLSLNALKEQGEIGDEEVSLLRVDHYAQKELMELTHGESSNVTANVIQKIREKIRGDSFNAGVKQGISSAKEEQARRQNDLENDACKHAEQDVEKEYAEKERKSVTRIRIIATALAVVFIAASIISVCSQWKSPIIIALIVVAVITTIEGVIPFFSKDNAVIKWKKRQLSRKKMKETDLRKEKYLDIIRGSKGKNDN